MAIGFLGVLRHEGFQLALGLLMLDEGRPRPAIHGRELGPGVRLTHVDRPHRFDASPGRLDAEEARGLAGLDAAPELLLGGEQKGLIERVGVDLDLDPLAPACMMERTELLERPTHMLCWSCAMCFSAAPSSEKAQGSMNLASNTASV